MKAVESKEPEKKEEDPGSILAGIIKDTSSELDTLGDELAKAEAGSERATKLQGEYDEKERTFNLLVKKSERARSLHQVESRDTRNNVEVTDNRRNAEKKFQDAGHFYLDLWKDGRGRHGDLSEVYQAHKSYSADIYKKADDPMSSQDMAAGGALMPVEFLAEILKIEDAMQYVKGMRTIRMNTRELEVPVVVETTHDGTVCGVYFGGLKVTKPGLSASVDATKVETGLFKLALHKYLGYARVEDELITGSPISAADLLNQGFAEAHVQERDYDRMRGLGVGEPLGLLASQCLIAVARQGDSDFQFLDAVNMFVRMNPRRRMFYTWYICIDVLPKLLTMQAIQGTPEAGLAFRPSSTSGEGPAVGKVGGTLLGLPVMFTDSQPTLNTQGDVALCDPTQMVEGVPAREGTEIESSPHIYFDSGEKAFRSVRHYDASVWQPSAITPRNGSANTQSPVIVLTDD